jgi:hypothetical protein
MKKQSAYGVLFQPMLMLMSLSTITVLGVVWFSQLLKGDGETLQAYPTGIPWIDNEAECKNSGRDWQEGVCWDSEHDPVF